MQLPESYLKSLMNTYSVGVRETPYYINGSCPICREGNSWGTKKRMFYMRREHYFHCHNCSKSWTTFQWAKEVTGLTFKEIMADLREYDFDPDFELVVERDGDKAFDLPTLPGECVNLRDELQIKYYSKYVAVRVAINYCENRRLFSAINAPKNLYCCLNDKFHGNRLIIPYYDLKGKINYYASRAILDSDTKAKYLMKFGADKPVFNLDKVDMEYPYIFVTEGQIDAMFLKNCVAISGTRMTSNQEQAITSIFPFHQIIWIYDNYSMEKDEVKTMIRERLKSREQVFLFENEFADFKDLNAFCVEKKQDFVDPALIIKSCYTGERGLIRLD